MSLCSQQADAHSNSSLCFSISVQVSRGLQERTYVLGAASIDEQEQWIQALNQTAGVPGQASHAYTRESRQLSYMSESGAHRRGRSAEKVGIRWDSGASVQGMSVRGRSAERVQSQGGGAAARRVRGNSAGPRASRALARR